MRTGSSGRFARMLSDRSRIGRANCRLAQQGNCWLLKGWRRLGTEAIEGRSDGTLQLVLQRQPLCTSIRHAFRHAVCHDPIYFEVEGRVPRNAVRVIHQKQYSGIAQGGQRIAKLDENVRVWCRTMLSSALSYRHIRYKDVRSSDLRKYCFCDMRCSWDALRVAVDDRYVVVRVVVGDPLRGLLQRRLNEAPISGIRQVGLPRVENDAIHLEHGQTMQRAASSSRRAILRRSAMASTGSYLPKRRSTTRLVRSESPSEQAASTMRAVTSMWAMASRTRTAVMSAALAPLPDSASFWVRSSADSIAKISMMTSVMFARISCCFSISSMYFW